MLNATVSVASSNGPSGNIRISADAVSLDGSGIAAASSGGDAAGSVRIRVNEALYLCSGSSITTAARESNAGSIEISAGDRLEMRSGRVIAAAAGGSGGKISIETSALVYVADSAMPRRNLALHRSR